MLTEPETDIKPTDVIDYRSYEDSNIIELQVGGTWYKTTPDEVSQIVAELKTVAAHADPTETRVDN